MDMSIFQEFVTLATHGSYVSAARELNMSQPALSRHIDAFEKHLNQKLLFDSRPLSLTTAGQVVLRHSGKLIHDYHNMLAELESLPPSRNEHIVVQDILHANTLYIGLNEAIKAANQEFGAFQLDYVNVDSSGLNAQQLIDRKKVDLSFEVTLSHEEIPELETKPGTEAIFIPEFHGTLVMGIPLDSPLASKETLRLKDFAHSRFILQMNRLSERFVKDFIGFCEAEGFYPNISFVPSSNALDFYSNDPGDGIHLLVAVDKKHRPLIADLVRRHVKVRALKEETFFGNAFVLVRKENRGSILSFLVDQIEQRVKQYHQEEKARIQ